MNLTPYLEDIERRIDEAQEEALLDAWKTFACGKAQEGKMFCPPKRKPSESNLDWKHVNVNDALEDESLMVLSQLEQCHRALASSGAIPMMMRANYGVGIIARMFGAKPFIMPYEADTLPNVYSIGGGADGIRRLLDRPEPELTAGSGAHVLSIAERYARIGEKYPKIGRFVRFENPDAQGPVDNCELLWGSDLFYAFYDEPELVHALLRRVTDTICRLVDEWQKIAGEKDGFSSMGGRLCKGGIFVRDDSAMNLQPEFFDEFIAPYDSEVLTHFGGGGVHFCGRGDHFAPALARIPDLTIVDMSQPHLNDMRKIIDAIPGSGINLLCPNWDIPVDGSIRHRIFFC